MNYDLSGITEIVQSGWTGDIYLSTEEAAKLNNGSPVTFRHENLHYAISKMIEGWPCVEDNDGGVLTYTKPEASE